MKKFILVFALISSSAMAWPNQEIRTDYYCTTGNYFQTGMSKSDSVTVWSNNLIQGVFKRKAISFTDKSTFNRKTQIETYKDPGSNLKLEIQAFHPYDGGQDATWGRLSDGEKTTVMNCYLGM